MNWTKLDRMGESRPIVFRFIQHKAQFYRAPHHLKLQTWRPRSVVVVVVYPSRLLSKSLSVIAGELCSRLALLTNIGIVVTLILVSKLILKMWTWCNWDLLNVVKTCCWKEDINLSLLLFFAGARTGVMVDQRKCKQCPLLNAQIQASRCPSCVFHICSVTQKFKIPNQLSWPHSGMLLMAWRRVDYLAKHLFHVTALVRGSLDIGNTLTSKWALPRPFELNIFVSSCN